MARPMHTTLRAAVLAGVSAIAITGSAHAANNVLFASQGSGASTGPLTPGQTVSAPAGLIQVSLDGGGTLSIVGPAQFSVGNDGLINITRGGVTALSAANGAPAQFSLNGAPVALTGSGGFNATGTGYTGMVLGGSAQIGGRNFGSGQALQGTGAGAPTAIFVAGAQPAPGISPTSYTGLPGSGGINIGGYNPILNAAIRSNPALSTLPLGQSQSQMASYLLSLGQTIGSLLTPTQLASLYTQ